MTDAPLPQSAWRESPFDDDKLKEVEEEVEESFAFGKKRGERGHCCQGIMQQSPAASPLNRP